MNANQAPEHLQKHLALARIHRAQPVATDDRYSLHTVSDPLDVSSLKTVSRRRSRAELYAVRVRRCMGVRRAVRPYRCACLCISIFIAELLVTGAAHADALGSAIYVRSDSDHTLVVSPRASATKRLGDRSEVDVSYAADVWTSASIDIRASASKPVTEQRNELDFAASHELDDMTLRMSYRYSSENDYESHGASAGSSFDFAGKSATLALNAYLFQDQVGRSGDPNFSRALSTLGARLSFTQILDPKMFAQLTYELVHLDGYQASPYRVVGIGGTGFGCFGASLCLPEREPSLRTKHAAALLLRRALSDALTINADYRFFIDDWGLLSHTIAAQLGLLLGADTLLSLRYRFYLQSGVRFYQAVYRAAPSPSDFTTRDREQSPMHDHRIGIDLQQRAPLGDGAMRFVFNLGIGADFYAYDNFVGLTSVRALEFTLALGLER